MGPRRWNPMRQTEVLQEIRIMRFNEAYGGWKKSKLTQSEAANFLGVSERTFRRYINRYEEKGLEGVFMTRGSARHPIGERLWMKFSMLQTVIKSVIWDGM